jgi:hypothetical protein
METKRSMKVVWPDRLTWDAEASTCTDAQLEDLLFAVAVEAARRELPDARLLHQVVDLWHVKRVVGS